MLCYKNVGEHVPAPVIESLTTRLYDSGMKTRIAARSRANEMFQLSRRALAYREA